MIINIHGAIGVGKTTTCQNIRTFLKAVGFDEPQINNPVLDLYYSNIEKYAFSSQLNFVADLASINDIIKNEKPMTKYIINDSSIMSTLIFGLMLYEDGKMTEDQFNTLIDIGRNCKLATATNVVLTNTTDNIMRNIQKRNRDIEKGNKEYFIDFAENYLARFNRIRKLLNNTDEVVVININDLNEKDVVDRVCEQLGIERKINRITVK